MKLAAALAAIEAAASKFPELEVGYYNVGLTDGSINVNVSYSQQLGAQSAAPAPAAESPPAPKATRGKKSASSATETTTAASVAGNATEAAVSTAKSDLDDLFGEDPQPTEKPAKEKPTTIEQVRDALVSIQTAWKDKQKAIDHLKKYTEGGAEALSKLPEVKYGPLVKDAKDVVAKAPTK